MTRLIRDDNRIPLLGAASTAGATTVLPLSAISISGINPLTVAIVDASGTQITSFGGGIQYANGTASATPTGTLALGYDGSNLRALATSASGVITMPTVAVTGTFYQATQPVSLASLPALATGTNSIGQVTANAGTNLNTSALALESGGNLATIVTNTNKIPSLGQALAASSVPVVLTAAQLTTLTPLSTIAVTQATASNLHATVDFSGTGLGTVQFWNGAGAVNNQVTNAGTFAVQAALNAETTKVIGTINIAAAQTVAAVTAITNALPAGTNLMGKVGIDQTTVGTTNAVTPVPASNSGWLFNYASALSTTLVQIKATAGTFGGYLFLFNPNTATTFIQVFNKASASVTLGTTVPDFVIPLPGVASASATGSAANMEMVMGIAMSTGITVAATTTAGGNTSPTNAVVATFLYK